GLATNDEARNGTSLPLSSWDMRGSYTASAMLMSAGWASALVGSSVDTSDSCPKRSVPPLTGLPAPPGCVVAALLLALLLPPPPQAAAIKATTASAAVRW